MPAQDNNTDAQTWLIAVAAPRELDAVLCAMNYIGEYPALWQCVSCENGFDVVWTGVGKSNAAGAIARVIDVFRHIGVLSVGIAGALPGSSQVQVGEVVCASRSYFGDEGVMAPDGFISCAQMGFAPFNGQEDWIEHPQRMVEWLGELADHIGPVACVSMCSGTDALAERTASVVSGQFERGIAEAMEGAAVALAAHRIDERLLTGELRVISNTTGDRSKQIWDLDGALKKLEKILGRMTTTQS